MPTLTQRVAEKEAQRIEALRADLEHRLAPQEWDWPEPPDILQTNPNAGATAADVAATWKTLQAVQQQRREAKRAAEEAVFAPSVSTASMFGDWPGGGASPSPAPAGQAPSAPISSWDIITRQDVPVGFYSPPTPFWRRQRTR
jgi:hypothetical protein